MTTLVGFLSLAFVPAPVFRHTGIVLGVGVAIALLLAMTVVPIFFDLMPAPKVPKRLRLIDAVNRVAVRIAIGRPWLVIGTAVVVAVISVAGIVRIKVDTNVLERLDADSPARVSRRFIQKNFAGTNFVDIYLTLTSSDGDFLNPERYQRLEEFQRAVASHAKIDHVRSITDLVDQIHREMGGDDAPKSRPLLAQYLLLFEMSGGDGVDRLIDTERKTLRMSARLPSIGVVQTHEIGMDLIERGREILGADVDLFVGGLNRIIGEWIGDIVAGQKQGLLFALLSTTLMMMLALRAFGAGILSMIPNVLPLMMLGGYIGWAWQSVDSDTIIVAMIAVGIVVGDTVHFMTRLRIESARTTDVTEAIRQTVAFSGGAIVKTSLILCGGFLPFAMSGYFTTRLLGTLLPMTIVVALLADLLLVPAMVQVGILRFRR